MSNEIRGAEPTQVTIDELPGTFGRPLEIGRSRTFLYECSACHATVAGPAREAHREWHEDHRTAHLAALSMIEELGAAVFGDAVSPEEFVANVRALRGNDSAPTQGDKQ